MRTVYLKKSTLATEPHTIVEEIAKLEAEIEHTQGRVGWLSSQIQTLPQALELTLRIIEGIDMAERVGSCAPDPQAKENAIKQRATQEEGLETYKRELEARRGELATLQKALREKQDKLSQYVAIQVVE